MFQKRKTILYFVFFALFLGVYLFCFPHQIQAKSMDTKGYYSKSFALMDGYSGRILGGKEEELPLANASTTKILTCILLLENGELTDYFTASPRAARQPKVHLGIKAEQAYNIQDMLYCLMLESFNDCAVLLAEYLSGSVEAFAVKMNEKAKEIGCTDTYFITPNGLDDQDERSFHHTTSKDLCRIMRYCVWESPQKEKFLKITQTPSYSFKVNDTTHTVYNRNQLLTTMKGAISGKTGYTADAGYCYVMAYEKDGLRFTAAFLGCGWPNNRNYKWKDAKKLMDYGIKHCSVQTTSIQKEKLKSFLLENTCPQNSSLKDWKQAIRLCPIPSNTRALQKTILLQEGEVVTHETSYVDSVHFPLRKNDCIGSYIIKINGEIIAESPLVANANVEQWSFERLFSTILKKFVFL